MPGLPPEEGRENNGNQRVNSDGHGSRQSAQSNCIRGHDIPRIDIPVLIVGAGPCGLFQAYLLSKLNVPCTIIERYPNRLSAPKAHALSPRTLEICRQVGLSTKTIRELGTPRSEGYWVNFITSLSGEEIGRLPYERMDVDVLESTPEMIHNIPQPEFELFVAQHLPKTVRLIRNASFVSCKEKDDVVITTFQDRETGSLQEVYSNYVIGCDGAKSKVRAHLGIECDGEDGYETMMTIHFNADLRQLVGKRVGMLHWIADPAVSGFIIAYDIGGNQVLICNVDPARRAVVDWTEEDARRTVSAAIGKQIPFNIRSFRPWILSRKVAKKYRKSRVFLTGDAAHAFPPTGGLGLNSGIGDVHNLAYKISAVLHGWAENALLDSYESERRHVAVVNSLQSIKNGKQIFSLLKALGTATGDMEQARDNLSRALRDPERRSWIEEEVQKQQEHFDNLELHIGYVYGSSAIPRNASHFSPKFVAGARLPHAWIEPLSDSLPLPPAVNLDYVYELGKLQRQRRKFSSLDLCAYCVVTFLVADSPNIYDVVREATAAMPVKIPVNIFVYGKDFAAISGSAGYGWARSCGLLDGGGIIIRPDQHILAILRADVSARKVTCVLKEHLGC